MQNIHHLLKEIIQIIEVCLPIQSTTIFILKNYGFINIQKKTELIKTA